MAFKYKSRPASQYERQAEQRGNTFESIFKDNAATFRARDGDNWIRILPPTWELRKVDDFGYQLFTHSYIGPKKATIICPAYHDNSKCPICEAAIRAERRGDKDTAGKLKAKKRYVSWVVDRKDESKGAQLWDMPWTINRDINQICKDKMTGELYEPDHPDHGYDISFEKIPKNPYPEYTAFQLAKRPSSVDDKLVEYAVKHPVPDMLYHRDYDTIKALFEGQEDEVEQESRSSSRDDEEDERESRQTYSKTGNKKSSEEDPSFEDRRHPDEDSDNSTEDEEEENPNNNKKNRTEETRSAKSRTAPEPEEDDDDSEDEPASKSGTSSGSSSSATSKASALREKLAARKNAR